MWINISRENEDRFDGSRETFSGSVPRQYIEQRTMQY